MSGKALVPARFLETTLTSLYTVPLKTTTLCDGIRVSNDTAASATFEVNVVPSGGSAGASNVMLPSLAVGAGLTSTVLSGMWMNAGDSIHIVASAATTLVVHIGGREFS